MKPTDRIVTLVTTGRRFALFVVALALLDTVASRTLAQTDGIGPPPGRLVDVGGYRLHLNCVGTGSPTVVIEAGASSFALDFALVQPKVAKVTRTCSYDRAGSGWSEQRLNTETPARVVSDLRSLLDKAGEKGPFVLVGASRGGVFVRLFQADYPADVAGMVLIDPTAEDQLFLFFEGRAVAITSLTPEQHRSLQPKAPVSVPTRQPQTGPPFDALPPDLYATRIALDRKLIASVPASVPADVVVEYATGDYQMLSRLSAMRRTTPEQLGDLPFIVLTRGRGSSAAQQAAHADIARMSRAGRHQVVPDSYHEIHLSHPDVVVQAVAEVVGQARTRTRQ